MEQNKVVRSLKPTLSGIHLWAIAVGLVISGDYFGWSYGWNTAGTLGFLVTYAFIALMYVTFIFSYTELTSAIPHAGGPFAYARRALGPTGGYLAGMTTLIEFVFAPPAISLAIGAYLTIQFPELDPKITAVCIYLVFMALNMLGMRLAANFELVITIIAIFELLVFMGVVSPGFNIQNFTENGWAGSNEFSVETIHGMMAAVPFAIWFFLAIEGAAMAAEEVKNPKKTIPKAYILAVITLVFLAVGVMIFAGSVGDWRELSNMDSPLPHAMMKIVGLSSGWLHMLVWLGLFGLVASFHGIMIGYSRQIFALSRAGYLPFYFSKVNATFRTPHRAILLGSIIGIISIYSDSFIKISDQKLTADIIVMSVFGALVMYIISMISLIVLRKNEPNLERTYIAPCYPIFPIVSMLIAFFALFTMIWFNLKLSFIFLMILLVGYVYFRLTENKRKSAPVDDMLISPKN